MGDGAFDAPPPMGGLGNFKGVMLCNRPSDEPSKVNGGEGGAAPFKSMISATERDQLGLPPCKNFEPSVKTRGPSAALRRHVRWLKELQEQMKDERDQVEDDDLQSEAKKAKMKAIFEKHREGVREMMVQRDIANGTTAPSATRDLPTSVAANKTAPPKKSAKPLWAMTEKEKDTFEDGEADDLINFAEGLDYEKYVGDLEFRQGVEAIRDRAGRLQNEQDAFKDALVNEFNVKADGEDDSTNAGSPRGSRCLEDGVDGQSLLGDLRSEYSASSAGRSRGAERYNADGPREWDGSTACGDDRPQVDREIKSIAEDVLESHPQIRAVHSKESVARIVERQQKKPQGPQDLISVMAADGAMPCPVITASEDTQTRLHKPVDPSMLPYLYRSPAV